LADRAAGRPDILFSGRKTRAQVWEKLAQTDLLVVPSLWYETAALVIQEAFAAGVPVVASKLGALEERVHHGLDGYLFPPGDSQALAGILSQLAADRNHLEQLQANIRPVFTIGQHVERILALYQRLVTPIDC
jgi:glycosyltransferase involved in cell wall biosynthesis